jgi:hypothetical protein
VRKRTWILAVLLLVGELWFLLPGVAAQSGPTLVVRAGFDGYFKVNHWVPFQVIVASEAGEVEGEVQIAIADVDNGQIVYAQPVVLSGRSRKQVTLYAFIRDYARRLTVQLVAKEQVLVRQAVNLQPLGEDTFLCGVASDAADALNYLGGLTPPTNKRQVQVAHLALDEIPAQGRALSSLDVLILDNLDTSPLSDSQREALRGWVAIGGHVVTCGGPAAPAAAAGLGDLLPVLIQGTTTTADLGGLGDLASAPWIANMPAVVAQVIPLPADADGGGTYVMAGGSDLPLIVRRVRDRGTVDYLAVDPDLEPVRTWIGAGAMWGQILFSPWTAQSSGALPDLSEPGSWTQIETALANIPGLDVPPVLLVIAFLFAYVIVVGPLNFMVLKLRDRRALAWITMPVLILAFSCAAYAVGISFRGRKAILSQASIVQAQLQSGVAAIDSYTGLYSPVRTTYDVRVPPQALVYRGMRYSYAPGSRETLHVEQGPPTYIRQMDIDIGTMDSFGVQTVQPWQGVEARVTLSRTTPAGQQGPSSLTGTYGTYRIEGTISNRSGATIRGCKLVFQSTVTDLGDLAAGEIRSLSVDVVDHGVDPTQLWPDELVGPTTGIGKEGRERERRRAILNALLTPYTYGVSPSRSPLSGLTLLGWLDQPPLQMSVEGVPNQVQSTNLLLVALPISTGIPGEILLPKGSMPWVLVDGDPGTAPNALYRYQMSPRFRFYLSSPQLPVASRHMVVETLILHVDPTGLPTGTPPLVSLKDATTGQWVQLPPLNWGENEIPTPERFVYQGPPGAAETGTAGSIEIEVETQSIVDNPISIDFTVTGRDF